MPDFNMPPGVSVNDIPGNRPEDTALEELIDNVFDQLVEKYPWITEVEQEWDDAICDAIQIAADLGYNKGFSEGQQEADMAKEYRDEVEDW